MTVNNNMERFERLITVSNKAIDSSCNSINDQDLIDCCGTQIKTSYGNNLQKLFLNCVIANTTNKLQDSFEEICNKYDIQEKLQLLNDYKPINVSMQLEDQLDDNQSLKNVVLNLKEVEKQELISSIRYIESDIEKLSELAGRLRAQVTNELNAICEEKEKITIALDHCKSTDNR